MLADPKREAEIEFEIMAAKEPWRKILYCAAKRLQASGHCKGLFSDEHGRHCVVGAIHTVAMEYVRGTSADSVYHEAVIRLKRHINMPIVTWNDMRANTAENVIATLETVARS